MSQYFRKGFGVKARLNAPGGKSMPESMKGKITEMILFQKDFIAHIILVRFCEFRRSCQQVAIAWLHALVKYADKKPLQRNDPIGVGGLGGIHDHFCFSLPVVTGIGNSFHGAFYRHNAFAEINVLPANSAQLTDAHSAEQSKQNAQIQGFVRLQQKTLDCSTCRYIQRLNRFLSLRRAVYCLYINIPEAFFVAVFADHSKDAENVRNGLWGEGLSLAAALCQQSLFSACFSLLFV